MSLTEENQPARATLRNIICQGQFTFALRWWCVHLPASSDVGGDGSWILIRKAINSFSGLCTNSRTTAGCPFHLSSTFMGQYVTDRSLHPCTVCRYSALFNSKRNTFKETVFESAVIFDLSAVAGFVGLLPPAFIVSFALDKNTLKNPLLNFYWADSLNHLCQAFWNQKARCACAPLF